MTAGSEHVLSRAKDFGADIAGVASVAELDRRGIHFDKQVFPEAQSAVALAVRHGTAAIRTGDTRTAQFDTVFTYRRVEEAAHSVARYLEDQGFPSVAVPSFLPIDMSDQRKGMVGSLDLRGTGGAAGIGVRGENGLLVTERFGCRVRLGAVLTSARLETSDGPATDYCDHCRRCVEACPAGALASGRPIDRRACGRSVFRHGLREFMALLERIGEAPPGEVRPHARDQAAREIWQNFMTGGYYSCWECQAQCEVAA